MLPTTTPAMAPLESLGERRSVDGCERDAWSYPDIRASGCADLRVKCLSPVGVDGTNHLPFSARVRSSTVVENRLRTIDGKIPVCNLVTMLARSDIDGRSNVHLGRC
jgi:hypothetical protein